MEKYLVTVIIPTLNEENFIRRCLESVIFQTFPVSKMDIIVVDGGSTDQTNFIVKDFQSRFSNIRLMNNPGRIQSIAFNLGVHNSNSPFIIRLDAHATYNSSYIELCINYLQSHPDFGNVGGICNIIPSRKGIIPEANAILNKVKFGIGGAAFRVGTSAAFVDTVPFGAFRREIIEKVGGMREDLSRGEDNEFNSRIKKAGYKIYMDPKIISTYYARDTILGSMRQMYKNGLSIGKLCYIDKNAIRLRHLIPLAFVLSLIFCVCFCWLSLIRHIGIGIIVAYLIAAMCSTICTCFKFGFKYIIILPWLFFLIHTSYGMGTIIGFFKGLKLL